MTLQLRAQRVALRAATFALLAGAAFGVALANATPVQRVTVSPAATVRPVGADATRAAGVAAVAAVDTAVAAVATGLPRGSAPPRLALIWSGFGQAGPNVFSISGQSWQLNLVCSGVPEDKPSGSRLVLSTTSPSAGVTIAPLTYVCPAGARGGQTTARFYESGDFALSVDSADPDVAWEIIVTNIP